MYQFLFFFESWGDGRTSSRLPRLAWPLTPMTVLTRCRARRAAPRRAPRGRNPEQGRLCRGACTATLRCVSHGAGLVRCERARAPQGFRCRSYVAQVRILARARVSVCLWLGVCACACVRVISAGTVKKKPVPRGGPHRASEFCAHPFSMLDAHVHVYWVGCSDAGGQTVALPPWWAQYIRLVCNEAAEPAVIHKFWSLTVETGEST